MSAATAATLADTVVCSAAGIRKTYGGVRALDGVDLEVRKGEVHAIVGENGAGKSTLMRVLGGVVQPDEGAAWVRGQEVQLRSVADANAVGIAIVFQELSLFPTFSVLANLFSLRAPTRLGLVRLGGVRERARRVLTTVGLDVDLDTPVARLSIGDRQLVEIAKALLVEPEILILDEPNSALNATETQRLFDVVRRLREDGVAVLYISHRLEEVLAIADVISIMRSGRIVASDRASNFSIPEIVRLMLGRDPAALAARHRSPADHSGGIELRSASVSGGISQVDLDVRAGEVVGLAGLEGSGVHDVFEVVLGRKRLSEGTYRLHGGRAGPGSIPRAVRAGVAYVPADRAAEGLMPFRSVIANLSHVTAGPLRGRRFVLDHRKLEHDAAGLTARLSISTPSIESRVDVLSGGNQQKVVLGKWLAASPSVVLLNDPTRGVDVGAKAEIYSIVANLAEEGATILFTSSELHEYGLVCDRALVFFDGRVIGELGREALTEHNLLEAINTGRIDSEPNGALGISTGGRT